MMLIWRSRSFGFGVWIAAVTLMWAIPPALGRTPNILFVMADDLGWSDTSNALTNRGHPSDFYETPTLERLATEGMAFTNAYACHNCAPTRAAIFSGQYAPRPTNRVYQVGDLNRGGNSTLLVGPDQGLPSGVDAIPERTITLAETLATAGYRTGYFGKFHVTDTGEHVVTQHGFHENYGGNTSGAPGAYHASNERFAGNIGPELDAYAGDYTQAYVDTNIKPFAHGVDEAAMDALVGTDKHVTDAMVDAAIDFMERHKAGPFFMEYCPYAVHTPIGDSQARSDLLAKYYKKTPGTEDRNESFGALIEGLDQSVARLIDYLQTTEDPCDPGHTLSENTLVIFYSDNGGRQSQSNNGPLKGQKGELDEGGVRVPMIAWSDDPNLVQAGTSNGTPVHGVDFYTTFASLAGATLPAEYPLDGADLSPIFADVSALLGRDGLYWHLPGYLVDSRNQRPQSVVRSGDWKLMYNYEDQSWELYNLTLDISEANNVATETPDVVAELGMQLVRWLDDVNAPLATLRPGKLSVKLTVTGTSYANGVIATHDNETLVIGPGQEMPIIVGQVEASIGEVVPSLPENMSLGSSPPAEPLVANEQTNGNAGVIRLAAPNPGNSGTETRIIGQTFRLPQAATIDAITVRPRNTMTFGHGEHVLLMALMEDTNANGIGDTQLGEIMTYDLAGVTIEGNQYVTLFLNEPLGLEAGRTYHFEIFWGQADPTHNWSMQRSGNTNGAYPDGWFINVLDDDTFPAGERLAPRDARDLAFFVLGQPG